MVSVTTPIRTTLRLSSALLFATTVLSIASVTLASEIRPNIVFILVDDLSYSDLGCYGNTIHDTPHIDRLAAGGMRFTQAYAPAPICSASRAAILTGKFPARLNFEFVTKSEPGQQSLPVPLQSPAFTLNLPLSERTSAEALTTAGYISGFFGKWHVSQHHEGYLGWSPTHGPLQQGFAFGDSDFGAHPYAYRTNKLREKPVEHGEFSSDSLTVKASQFIRDHQDAPFFLYLSHYFVHDPVHSRCEWLTEKYRTRLKGNGPKSRAAYGAMVETLDDLIGDLLKTLEEEKIADRTVVVLMSDNGGHPNHTTNAPLRGSKWNLYEGGIRIPMIVRWPGHVPAGSTCKAVVHGCDLLPTFCEMANAKCPPETIDGISLLPVLHEPQAVLHRGQSLIWHFPYYHPEKRFTDKPARIGVGDFVTSQTRPHSAIRRGKWKLIKYYENGHIELYDLKSDIAESRNVASENRKLAAELESQLQDSLSSMQARLPTADSQ